MEQFSSPDEYPAALEAIACMPEAEMRAAIRHLCRTDLWYLSHYVLGWKQAAHPWLYARHREVDAEPDGYLDLWFREAGKSSCITIAKTIQDILRTHGDGGSGEEWTFGIFSHTRPQAKSFLAKIKREFEGNEFLRKFFPDILWTGDDKPGRWSLDEGIIVKRKSNPPESTIEAWGLVDGQPTGKHFAVLVYDDVVTLSSVGTSEQIEKTTNALSLSFNLGQAGGKRRFIGTRYHFADTYKELLERGTAKARIYPAVDETGEPVLLSREALAEKRRDMGPYVYACLGAGTLVTMADWSQKAIESVVVGDVVVGWAAVHGSKSTLTATKVIATGSRVAQAVESTLEDGSVIVHTPQHRWWTGRTSLEGGKRKLYSPLGFNYAEQRGLCKALDLGYTKEALSREQIAAAGYLAGIIDGEGGVRHRVIQITQDYLLHPQVCAKIEWALEVLSVPYAIWERDRRDEDKTRNIRGIMRIYTIHGGRQERVRLLHILGDFLGKRADIVSQAYGARNFAKRCRVKLTAQIPVGEVEVFNIQTNTGNYIANGFCSSNSQMLLNPVAEGNQTFLPTWVRYWACDSIRGLNIYLLCDPASSKKKGSDYTVFWVVGLGADGNIYVLDFIRDKLNLTERAEMLFFLHQKWFPRKVGWEKYGMMADIEHIQFRQKQENYRFEITELGGTMPKADRIRRLVPYFEQHRIYLPVARHYTGYDKKNRELIREFVENEYCTWPLAQHDDALDALARIDDLGVTWPIRTAETTADMMPDFEEAY